MLLGYIVAKVCTSPRILTSFTRLFLLMRGWGLGARLIIKRRRGESKGEEAVLRYVKEERRVELGRPWYLTFSFSSGHLISSHERCWKVLSAQPQVLASCSVL